VFKWLTGRNGSTKGARTAEPPSGGVPTAGATTHGALNGSSLNGRGVLGLAGVAGFWPHAAEAMIDLRAITKVYETDAGPFLALKGIDLQVYPGEFVAVVGKSGSGKSTLINMFTGIDHPTDGEVLVARTHIRQLDEGQMAEWRGRHLGIVFQFFQLLPTLTLIENVMLPMDLCHMFDEGERPERAMHLLERMDLADDANKFPAAVSGGHQQRAAIARALANDPPILVADEPTGNLDSRTADDVFRLFESLVADGKTILMVTHDSELAARVPRALTLADGLFVDEARRLRDVVQPVLRLPPEPETNALHYTVDRIV
jgi:putative ABC transport system ATP-binding protein